jgi:hypothetical protein
MDAGTQCYYGAKTAKCLAGVDAIQAETQSLFMANPIINFASISGKEISANYENLPDRSQIVLVDKTSGKTMADPVTGAAGSGRLTIELPLRFPSGAYCLQAQDQSGKYLAQSVQFYVS